MLSAKIDIERGRIILPRYPFPARETRILEREDVVEIIDWFPLAILTTKGECLFVPSVQLDALKAFCGAHAVPFTKRYDVWEDLLDSFMDTEFSPEIQTATCRRLREQGHLTTIEIASIRETVKSKMINLTAHTWEWQNYGLFDVLSAMKPKLLFGRLKWAKFYAEAMEVAQRGFGKNE